MTSRLTPVLPLPEPGYFHGLLMQFYFNGSRWNIHHPVGFRQLPMDFSPRDILPIDSGCSSGWSCLRKHPVSLCVLIPGQALLLSFDPEGSDHEQLRGGVLATLLLLLLLNNVNQSRLRPFFAAQCSCHFRSRASNRTYQVRITQSVLHQ